MTAITRKDVGEFIARLMPNIIRGVHLNFLSNRRITQTQFLVITAIHSRGRCSMRILAESIHVSMPTISGIVDRLVTSGSILREANPSDRRLVMVELSAKGKQLVEQFQKAAGTRWEEILKPLSQEELESLHRIFRRIAQEIRSGPEHEHRPS